MSPHVIRCATYKMDDYDNIGYLFDQQATSKNETLVEGTHQSVMMVKGTRVLGAPTRNRR